MDKINIVCLSFSILPLLFGIYLIISRLNLSCVNKYVLKYTNAAVNSFLFIVYSILTLFVVFNNLNLEYIFKSFIFSGFEVNFGFLVSKENLILTTVAALFYSLISIYSLFYFEKKKHFVFTKRRFHCLLAILASNTYFFLISSNLFQMLIFWILQGAIIFVFSHFDMFKSSVNFNITRANRINLIGDFSLTLALFILFKYSVILNGDTSYLNVFSLQDCFSKLIMSANIYEVNICLVAFIVAISTRLFIFPFNCYLSFLTNSTDIFYLCASSISNLVFGIYLFFLINPFIEIYQRGLYLAIFFAISGVISILLIIFEKNIKIIFGCLISALNAFFLAGCLYFNKGIGFIYLALSLLTTIIFMKLAYKGAVNIKAHFFTKKKNFIIEKTHIFIFEKLPYKLFKLIDAIDKHFVQNIILFFIEFLNTFVKLFVIKIKSKSKINYVRAILIMLALILIFAIFIALFGTGRYNSELIR